MLDLFICCEKKKNRHRKCICSLIFPKHEEFVEKGSQCEKCVVFSVNGKQKCLFISFEILIDLKILKILWNGQESEPFDVAWYNSIVNAVRNFSIYSNNNNSFYQQTDFFNGICIFYPLSKIPFRYFHLD